MYIFISGSITMKGDNEEAPKSYQTLCLLVIKETGKGE